MNLGFKKKQCPEVKYLKGNNVKLNMTVAYFLNYYLL